jgi:hypothetical protein
MSTNHLRWSPHFPVAFVPCPCNSMESKPAPLLAKYPPAQQLAARGCSSQFSWTRHCGSWSLKLLTGSCLFLKSKRGPSINFEEVTTNILQFPHGATRVCCHCSVCLWFSTVTSTAIALGEAIGLVHQMTSMGVRYPWHLFYSPSSERKNHFFAVQLAICIFNFVLHIYITSKDIRRLEHWAQVTDHYSVQVQDRFAQMQIDCQNSLGFSLCVFYCWLEVINWSSLFGPFVRERWCRSRLALAWCGKTHGGGGSRLHEPKHPLGLDY